MYGCIHCNVYTQTSFGFGFDFGFFTRMSNVFYLRVSYSSSHLCPNYQTLIACKWQKEEDVV
jgi:hypothetical protein